MAYAISFIISSCLVLLIDIQKFDMIATKLDPNIAVEWFIFDQVFIE
jgi:hypothetical protein